MPPHSNGINRRDILAWASASAILSPLSGIASELPPSALTPFVTSQSTPPFVEIEYLQDGVESTVQGELVAQRENFGSLVLDRDGSLTAIAPSELKSKKELDGSLVPSTQKELGEKLLALMPPGSKFTSSEHFVICYNTTDAYAKWNTNLYERLFKGFQRFWKTKGLELSQPRFPLVAMVFDTKANYVEYASKDFKGAENTYGYYHQATNRLASYDLTGVEGILPAGAKVNRDSLINQILSRPEAERTVATIVHEACHQIAFNSGLQIRLGNNPLWLSEGIATYFESPDLNSQSGWGGIGKVNMHNYRNLMNYIPIRPADSLETLLTQDSRMRDGETMVQTYAECWGLTHFLIQTRSRELIKYMEALRASPIGTQHSAKERLDLFRSCFGEDLNKVDRDFMRHIQRLA